VAPVGFAVVAELALCDPLEPQAAATSAIIITPTTAAARLRPNRCP
jgi:hypothetical protein